MLIKFKTIIALVVLLSSTVSYSCQPLIQGKSLSLTVSPNGTLKDLPSALNCVGYVIMSKPILDSVTVNILPGIYRQNTEAKFPEFLASWPGKIIIKGTGPGVVISGAEALKKPVKYGGKANIYSVELSSVASQEISDPWNRDHGSRIEIAPPELIITGEIFELASQPNDGYYNINNVVEPNQFQANVDKFTGDLRNLSVQGFFKYDWADSIRRVSHFDSTKGLFTLTQPPVKYGLSNQGRFVLKGLVDFVDQENEYAALPATNKLIFFSTSIPQIAEITKATTLLYSDKINNLTVDNIRFESTRGNVIDLSGTKIILNNIEVKNAGWIGIKLNGENNVVKNSKVMNSGFSAVEISGGNRKNLIAAQSGVEATEIINVGRLAWSSVPAIRIDGVGNYVKNSKIKNGPHSGIFYFGNNHFIDSNEVSYVAQRTGDVGAIYTGRDWAGRGHVVSNNYIHDIRGYGVHGATALYLDDQASGVTLKNNIIWGVDRGILLGGGRDNIITNNIIMNATQCIKFDDRGLNWQSEAVLPGGAVYKSLDIMQGVESLYISRYPALSSIYKAMGYPINNRIQKNIGLCRWDITSSAEPSSWLEPNWKVNNPGFTDPRVMSAITTPDRSAFKIDWNQIQW